MKKERQTYLKRNDLTTWNQLYFCTLISPSHSEHPQFSDQDFAMDKLQASQSTVQLDENLNRISQKHISQLQNRASRNRLAEIRSHDEAVALHEDCTPKR